jgi:hypothetical protein
MEVFIKELDISEEKVKNLLSVGQTCLNRFQSAQEWFEFPRVLNCDLQSNKGFEMDPANLKGLPDNMFDIIIANFEQHKENRSINLFYIFDNNRVIIVPADA